MNALEALQLQRSMFAWLVTLFPPGTPEHDEAIDRLDKTQGSIQRGMNPRFPCVFLLATAGLNVWALRRLNAAVIAMPDAAWRESEGAL